MKVLYFKVFVLFCVLSIVFSASFGCSYSTSTGGSDDGPVAKNDGETKGSKTSKDGTVSDSGEYPAPPPKITAAEFKLIDGKTFSVTESKGKVVLINLWATWCGPCRKEMPALVEMQDKYRDKGFEIIGLDTDPETVEEIEVFAEKMKLNYKLGWADREMVTEFFTLGQMNGIPQSFLINRDGKLTGIFQGGSTRVVEKMRETVAKVVAE